MDEDNVRAPAVIMPRWLHEKAVAEAAKKAQSWAEYVRQALIEKMEKQ